jgi:hypothetical protein
MGPTARPYYKQSLRLPLELRDEARKRLVLYKPYEAEQRGSHWPLTVDGYLQGHCKVHVHGCISLAGEGQARGAGRLCA